MLIVVIAVLFGQCKPIKRTSRNSENRLQELIFLSRGNQDIAFGRYLKECMDDNRAVIIPKAFQLNLKKARFSIRKNLQLTGGGTISSRNTILFKIENGAAITIKNIKFEGFNCILNAGKRDVSFSLKVDSIKVENCKQFIFAGANNKELEKVGPIVIEHSVFKDCIGSVIEIRNIHLSDVKVRDNHFFNTKKLKNKSAVVELGNGGIYSKGLNIEVSNNVIDYFNFVDKACAIIVHGASNVNISKNKISRICSLSKTDKDTHGIYIKANNATITFNELIDAGEGEAAIINKGLAKNHSFTTPGTYLGDKVLIAENKISYTDDYHSRAKKNITGITVTGTNQIVRNNIIENVTNGIELRSGPILKGIKYDGGFKIIGNRIRKLQHHFPNKDKRVVRGISIMQNSCGILIKDNEIILTNDIPLKLKYSFGITCLTHSDIKDIKIENNTIINEIPFSKQKTSYAVSFRTKGVVENLSVKNNTIKNFSFGVLLNDNNNLATYKNAKVDNRYFNIAKKKNHQIITEPSRHSIQFKKE